MIRSATIAALLAAAIALPQAAAAQEIEYRAIEKKNIDSGKTPLDRAKGYIFITGPMRSQGVFIKTADAADLAEYESEWREELEEAQRKYPGRLKDWQVRAGGRRDPGEKPVEPTEANFSIGPIQRNLLVGFGPQYIYSKSESGEDKSFSYLIEVEPGEYTYYGPLFYLNGTAPMGQCNCMGSVKFAVPAGQITSLGDFLTLGWVDDEAAKATSVVARAMETGRKPVPTDWSAPAELAAWGAAPADLRAAGKMDNYFGIMIGRMPPVDGVLAYERDTVIDVKGLLQASAAAAAAAAAADAGAAAEAAAKQADESEAVIDGVAANLVASSSDPVSD